MRLWISVALFTVGWWTGQLAIGSVYNTAWVILLRLPFILWFSLTLGLVLQAGLSYLVCRRPITTVIFRELHVFFAGVALAIAAESAGVQHVPLFAVGVLPIVCLLGLSWNYDEETEKGGSVNHFLNLFIPIMMVLLGGTFVTELLTATPITSGFLIAVGICIALCLGEALLFYRELARDTPSPP